MVNLLKKYWLLLLIFFVLIIIGVLLILAYSKNSFLNNSNNSANSNNTKLSGYENLVAAFDSLDSDSKVTNNSNYLRMKSEVISLKNPNLSDTDKYKTLILAETNLSYIYYVTNDNKLYSFNDKLTKFTKTNFPKQYKSTDFLFYCFDPACADSPPPKEILQVIDEINASNLLQEIKDGNTTLLKNYMYVNKKDADAIVANYFVQAQNILSSPDYKKEGLNTKLYNEIIDYLKNTYPDDLKKYLNIKSFDELDKFSKPSSLDKMLENNTANQILHK